MVEPSFAEKRPFFFSKGVIALLVLGWMLYVGTALWNIGFIALDEYWDMVDVAIPAQKHTPASVISEAGFRHPIPPLVMLGLANLGLSIGLDAPLEQFRFVLAMLGSFSYWILAFCMLSLFGRQVEKDSKILVGLFLIGFYFLAPLIFTRPMIESLSAPFLTLSVLFATKYYLNTKQSSLLLSMVFLTVASIFRSQAGVCGLALLLTVIFLKRYRHLFVFAVIAAGCFLAAGFVDTLLGRSFHQSLFSYVSYNLLHSSTHGTTHPFSYILLFFALTLPPALVMNYRVFHQKVEYQKLVPTVLFFLTFLVAHSLVPHKEERFMILILPIFLVLLVPLVHHLWAIGSRWRLGYFMGLNFILLVFAVGSIPQNNVISLVRYVDCHPKIEKVWNVGSSVEGFFPRAFIGRPVVLQGISTKTFSEVLENSCYNVYAVREDLKHTVPDIETHYQRVARFAPGLLEYLVVKANPKRNARRGAIELYKVKGCDRDSTS